MVATHGRSFWILDDLTPLQQLKAENARADAWLFSPRNAVRFHPAAFQGTPEPRDEPAGQNPPAGAVIDYVIRARPGSPVRLEIVDERGTLVRRWSSDDPRTGPDLQKISSTPDWVSEDEVPGASAGMHRFVWDLKYAAPNELRDRRGALHSGVRAPPGRYTVRLTAAGRTLTAPLTVTRDPRLKVSDADLQLQFELARQIEAERVAIAVAVARAGKLREGPPPGRRPGRASPQ